MNDQQQRKVAGEILDTAKKTVTQDRGNSHGGAEDSFALIGQLWSDYANSAMAHRSGQQLNKVVLTPFDVAQMMVLLKVARSVHGDPGHTDHYIDAAGYSSLAAGLAGVAPATSVAVAKPYKERPPAADTYDPLSSELASTLDKAFKK